MRAHHALCVPTEGHCPHPSSCYLTPRWPLSSGASAARRRTSSCPSRIFRLILSGEPCRSATRGRAMKPQAAALASIRTLPIHPCLNAPNASTSCAALSRAVSALKSLSQKVTQSSTIQCRIHSILPTITISPCHRQLDRLCSMIPAGGRPALATSDYRSYGCGWSKARVGVSRYVLCGGAVARWPDGLSPHGPGSVGCHAARFLPRRREMRGLPSPTGILSANS